MSSGFAGSPGDGAAPGAVVVRSEGGSAARESRKVDSARGMNPRPARREGGATRIRHRRSRVAFTCIFHLSFRGVALPGSTYNPPSNQRALPTTSRAPADSHWPRRIDVAANPSSSLRGCILLFYLPTLRADGGGRCMCAPFLCSFLRHPDDVAREDSAGREVASLVSPLRKCNPDHLSFIPSLSPPPLCSIVGRTPGLCLSSSSWPLPLAS